MRLLTGLLLLVPLCAQEAAKAPEATAKPAQEVTPQAATKPAAEAQAVSGEGWLQGSFEVGYRWIPNIDGSFNTYRSVVNLGEGTKLFNAAFRVNNPSKRFFDHADVNASSWGGDPYNTLRVNVEKQNAYRLTTDYRNIAYFNFLPSFANPALNRGVLLDQNSFDTAIRTTAVQLDLLPNKWITPYFGFDRNTQFGRGVTVFHQDINEYPVASLYSDQTNNYRGGVRMEMGHYHLTLEQGGTTFKDDQGASDNLPNPGNRTNAFLGTTLALTSMSELYRVRGDSIYTKGLLAVNPYSWMSVTGEFVYALPHTDVQYDAASSGTFYLQRILQFYSTGRDVLTGDANMPHISGNVTVEVRPTRRLRIVQYWMTDRLHNAANALLAESFLIGGAPLTDQQIANDRLVMNYSQEQIDAYYDLTSHLTVRGGYRYMWGDSDVRAPLLIGLTLESANLRRQVGIAGFNYRIGQKFRVNGDAEGSASGQTFFRTSLQDYQKAHIRGRYDLTANLRLGFDFSLLNNSNPSPSVKLDFSSKVESASLYWTPKALKGASLLADYSRSSVRSNILYLVPQTLTPAPSIYRENAHSFTVLTTMRWFTLGGSFFLSAGSRPTDYYQPLARVAIPINKHVQWMAEWRWYSMAETIYAFENFRSNQIVTSVRFTR